MRIYHYDLWRRTGGALFGLGLCAFGIFSLLQMPEAPNAALADRSLWMSVTMNLAGVGAILTSWLAPDLSGSWCRSPRFPLKK